MFSKAASVERQVAAAEMWMEFTGRTAVLEEQAKIASVKEAFVNEAMAALSNPDVQKGILAGAAAGLMLAGGAAHKALTPGEDGTIPIERGLQRDLDNAHRTEAEEGQQGIWSRTKTKLKEKALGDVETAKAHPHATTALAGGMGAAAGGAMIGQAVHQIPGLLSKLRA